MMMVSSGFLRSIYILQGAIAALAQSAVTAPPILTVTTAVPSATASDNAVLPSQAALPPEQPWCPSRIFCPGHVSVLHFIVYYYSLKVSAHQLLQTMNIAHLFPDDKTFADKVVMFPELAVTGITMMT